MAYALPENEKKRKSHKELSSDFTNGEEASGKEQKLKSISKHTQVLAITHLPIVASQSDTQLLITKKIIDNKTITMIKELNDDERIEELAKMISPTDKTGKSKELAKNMIYRQ